MDRLSRVLTKIENCDTSTDAQDAVDKILHALKLSYMGFGKLGESIDNRIVEMNNKIVQLDQIQQTAESAGTRCDSKIDELAKHVNTMYTAIGEIKGQQGSSSGQGGKLKSVVEHKIIQSLGELTGEKGNFRQWHQKFANAMGEINGR